MERTPEEIKKGLSWCGGISQILKGCSGGCPYYVPDAGGCQQENLTADALALIQRLEVDKIALLEESHAIRKDLFDKIQQLEAQVPRWIPVEERLPEKYQRVLGTCCMGVFETMYDGKYWRIAELPFEDTITHWMPLPEAPKEDAE